MLIDRGDAFDKGSGPGRSLRRKGCLFVGVADAVGENLDVLSFGVTAKQVENLGRRLEGLGLSRRAWTHRGSSGQYSRQRPRMRRHLSSS